MHEQARLRARAKGVPQAIVQVNGDIVEARAGHVRAMVGEVPSGRLVLDGDVDPAGGRHHDQRAPSDRAVWPDPRRSARCRAERLRRAPDPGPGRAGGGGSRWISSSEAVEAAAEAVEERRPAISRRRAERPARTCARAGALHRQEARGRRADCGALSHALAVDARDLFHCSGPSRYSSCCRSGSARRRRQGWSSSPARPIARRTASASGRSRSARRSWRPCCSRCSS